MLLLHTDVFLTTGEIVLQRAFGELRAGPGPLQIAAAVLLHCDPFTRWPSPSRASGMGGGGGGGGVGKKGEGEGEVGKGEVDQPQAQCLPRISENVPLERSHTRHGKNQCAPSHTHACLIYIHGQATNGCVRTVGACHRLVGSPGLIWSNGSGGDGGAGDCARHHPFIGISPSHHL